MKKILSLVLSALLTCSLLLVVGCNNKPVDNRPVLKIGMECAYQPYNWTQFDDSNGAVPIYQKAGQYANGYDIKIAQIIADQLGMRLEVHAYEWGSLVPAVQSGALDLIVAGMSPTADRKELVDFSDPYLTSNLVIVVRKDGAFASATSLADFAGANIAAQDGTFHADAVMQIENRRGENLFDFPTMLMALKAKTIDGYVAEEPGAIADCQGNSELTYINLINNSTGFTINDLSNVTIAIGVQKGSDLLAKVNTALAGISEERRAQLLNEAITQAAQLGL